MKPTRARKRIDRSLRGSGSRSGPTAAAAVASALLLLSCASARFGTEEKNAGVTLPAAFAEGKPQPDGRPPPAPEPASAAAGSAEEAAPPGGAGAVASGGWTEPDLRAKRVGGLPDPEPLRLTEHWEYELEHRAGEVRVLGTRKHVYPDPVVTARKIGRFAVELWIGKELIDRVRFDFPLLAAEEPRLGSARPLHDPPSFEPKAHVRQRVLVPASSRATRALLVDRATGRTMALPWPPDQPLGPPGPRSAGSSEPRQPGG